MKRLLAVVLGALLLLTVAAPGAAAWEPVGGAQFNNPNGTKAAKWRLVNHVNRAIMNARPGSQIYMSTYLFDSQASVDAIQHAQSRNVQIQIAVDGVEGHNSKTERIARILNGDDHAIDPDTGELYTDEAGNPLKWGLDNSHLTFCVGACRAGNGGDNHAKYYVFTQTGTAANVVMVSSSNLNAGGAVKGWNDLYTVKRNAGMVTTYKTVHDEMMDDRRGSITQAIHGIFTSRFFPFPRSMKDPVLSDLSQVRCRGANGGAGVNGRTKINISMFYWGGARGEPIARRVIELGKQGCVVQVIIGAPTRVVGTMLRKAARARQIQLWDSRYDRNGDGEVDLRTHEKYVLINGYYSGDRSSWRVHTGSANWGPGSLYYTDENTLNIASRGAYGQYVTNWRYIAKYGARRIGR